MKYKYGWGDCSFCGGDVGATKNGLAVRHGFIRIKIGIRRLLFPGYESGRDHHPCGGSGKKLAYHYIPDYLKVNLEQKIE